MRLLTSPSSAPSSANNGIVINESGKVGIGIPNPDPKTKLHVTSHDLYAGYFTSDSLSSDTHVIHAEYNGPPSNPYSPTAIYGRSVSEPDYGIGGRFEGGFEGLIAQAVEPGIGSRFGISAAGQNGDVNNYGIQALAAGGINAYGVYGFADGATANNYAAYASGDLVYTGNLINASDAKLKENVRPLEGSLNKLMRLQPKSFNFTNDEQYAHMNLPTGEHYGLIAQEVEQVLPELVSDNSHPSAAESRGERSDDPYITYKGLNSMELIPLLIDAIKEQQQEIESLKAEVNLFKSPK